MQYSRQKSDKFQEIIRYSFGMQWLPLPMALSEDMYDFLFEEGLFRFDLNKFAYVCFIDKMESNKTENIRSILSERRKLVIDENRELVETISERSDCQFLTLYIIDELNQNALNHFPKPSLDEIGTYFLFDEFIQIAKAEESNPLTIWKFAKAYSEFINECEIKTDRGNLDVFVAYKWNNFSLWATDVEKVDEVQFKSNFSKRYIKGSAQKRNEHMVHPPVYDGRKTITVYNYCDYAPFYKEVGDMGNGAILLEDFIRPVWFLNDQEGTQHPQFIISQLEMFAFWLLKLKDDLEDNFFITGENSPLIIRVNIGQGFKYEMRSSDVPSEIPLKEIKIPVVIDSSEVSITIPVDLALWYAKSDNQGERHAVFHLLMAILQCKSGDKEKKLREIIDRKIPIGIAKMASILANANNIKLETRFLPVYRKIQQHDISDIRMNLTRYYGLKVFETSFKSTEDRKKMCFKIATILHDHLIAELKKYDAMQLVPFLLAYHEACVQENAVKQLDRPARIALFGMDSDVVMKEFVEEQDRAKAALAIRCLIEVIVAYNMVEGTKMPNFDDVDLLMALMHERITWATVSDGIHLGIYDPPIKLLLCGRIDLDFDSINSKLFLFTLTKTEIELDQYNSGFEKLFNVPLQTNIDENSPSIKEIEDAFFEELGISFLRLHDFITALVTLTRTYNVSVFVVEEKDLFIELHRTKYNWTDSEIASALNVLSLLQGWDIENPPNGYRSKDVKPWYYNRALSFIRRPIAKLTKDNKVFYLWSYRHLYAAFDNIYMLLSDGIFWNPGNGALTQLNRKYANRKGDEFRAEVHSWLKENSDFEIKEQEIDINQKAKLKANDNLGDIDIFAVDHTNKVIYSIECKSTSESKSIHDFRADIYKYIDPNGKGYIKKHLNRHEWLKQNNTMLNYYVINSHDYQIISLIITAFEIPLSYFELSPIPLISFPKLRLEGIGSLQNILNQSD